MAPMDFWWFGRKRSVVIRLRGHSGEWRNGRRAGFRCQCPSGRGGSSPPSPTMSGSTNCDYKGHELERGRDLCVWWDSRLAAGQIDRCGSWSRKSPAGKLFGLRKVLCPASPQQGLRDSVRNPSVPPHSLIQLCDDPGWTAIGTHILFEIVLAETSPPPDPQAGDRSWARRRELRERNVVEDD